MPLLGTAFVVQAPLLPLVVASEGDGLYSRALWTLSSFLAVLLAGAIAAGVLAALRGERPRVGAMLAVATARLGTLLLASFLGALLVLLGGLLFIVPGAIAWAGLFVIVPAIVAEPGLDTIGALRRSWELTRGSRFVLFVAAILMLAIFVGTELVIALFLLARGESWPVAAVAVELVITAAVLALSFAVPAVAYHALVADGVADGVRS